MAAAGVSVLLWASAFVVIRFVGRSFDPGALALARLAVGSVALGCLMLSRGERPPRGRALAGAVGSGLLWFGVYNVALNSAERRIDAGTAALLVNTAPVMIAVLAAVALREAPSRAILVGCLISLAGVALIGAGVSAHGAAATWGAALCVMAALAYAVGLIVQKPALREASALSVTWVACTVAALASLAWEPTLADELGHAPASAIAWTVYLGLGPTAIGFGAWSFALARTDASRLGVTTYLLPPLSVLIGWIALAQTPPLLALPGGLLCLSGVAVARRRQQSASGSRRRSAAFSVGIPSRANRSKGSRS